MKYEFDYELMKEDAQHVKEFFFGFSKSVGPQPKSIGTQPVEGFEVAKTVFMLGLVQAGPSKIIRGILVALFTLVVYLVVFRHAGPIIQLLMVFAVAFFWLWMFYPEYKKAKETLDADYKFGVPHVVHELYKNTLGRGEEKK